MNFVHECAQKDQICSKSLQQSPVMESFNEKKSDIWADLGLFGPLLHFTTI